VRFLITNNILRFVVLISSCISIAFLGCNCGGGRGDSGSSPSNNSATLTWDAPTTNADGTPLTDLAGYKVYYGTTSGNYTDVIDVGNVITYKVEDLQPGTDYFAVTVYNNSRNEGGYSNEVRRRIN
jgi:hypothetical protein